MSALPPEADIRQRIEHVCFVPIADMASERRGLCSDVTRRGSPKRSILVQRVAGLAGNSKHRFRAGRPPLPKIGGRIFVP